MRRSWPSIHPRGSHLRFVPLPGLTCDGPDWRTVLLPWSSLPLRCSQRGGLTSRIHLPHTCRFSTTEVAGILPVLSGEPSSRVSTPASLRLRRFVTTLTVYSPPAPSDLFQPLTPLGFVSRFPVRRLQPGGVKVRGPDDGVTATGFRLIGLVVPGVTLKGLRRGLPEFVFQLASPDRRSSHRGERSDSRLPSCVAAGRIRHRRPSRSASSSRVAFIA